MPLTDIPEQYFRRQDESSDFQFYQAPRLVAHIDDAAIRALGEFLRPRVPDGADVLDLMSAYLTHLPPDVRARCRRVSGLGMNDAEMAANVQLTDHVVHSLNDEPALPYPDAAFDVALCTVSVQYLLHPLEVFAEVRRVLKPEGHFYAATNGEAHLRELDMLGLRVVAGGEIYNGEQHTFKLENGAEELSRQFAHVDLHLMEGNLVVTEVEPVIAFMRSTRLGAQLTEEHIPVLRDIISQEIAEHGSFFITKSTGVFDAYGV